MSNTKSKNFRSLMFTILLLCLAASSASKALVNESDFFKFRSFDKNKCFVGSAGELADILSSTVNSFNEVAIRGDDFYKNLIAASSDLTEFHIKIKSGNATVNDANSIVAKYKEFFTQLGAEDTFSKLPESLSYDDELSAIYLKSLFNIFFQALDDKSISEDRPFYFKEDFIRSVVYTNSAAQLKSYEDQSTCISPLDLGVFDELYTDLNSETVELFPIETTTFSVTTEEFSKGRISFAFFFKISLEAVAKGEDNQVFTYTTGNNVISLSLEVDKEGKSVNQVFRANNNSKVVVNTSTCTDLALVIFSITKEYDSYIFDLTIKSTVKNTSDNVSVKLPTDYIEFGTFVFPPIKLTIIEVYRILTHCTSVGTLRLYEIEISLQLPRDAIINFQNIIVDTCETAPPDCEFFEIVKCSACKDGLVKEDGNCQSNCSEGKYLDIESQTCLPCNLICKTCIDSASNCTTCPEDTYLLNSTCISACPSGTYPSASQVCEPCKGDCEICTGPNSCNACKTGFLVDGECLDNCPKGTYPQFNPNICLPCDPQCRACTNNACTECKDGFFLSGEKCLETCPIKTFPNIQTNTCDSCPENCDACNSSDKCDRCQSGFYLEDGKCKTDCKAGSVSSNNGICIPCEKYCDICLSNNTSQCTQCEKGKFNQNGICVDQCASNQFVDAFGNCKDCSVNCIICDDITSCSKCSSPLILFISQCVDVCPNSYVEKDGVCIPCDTECKNCLSTNVQECTLCFEGKLLYDGSCIDSCPIQAYQNGKICSDCNPDCTSCSNGITCDECRDPKFLKDGKCVDDCGDGYTQDGSACHPCQVTDCVDCSGNKTTCGKCSKGKVLLNGQCVPLCSKGTYNFNGVCLPCDQTCAACSGPDSCTECNNDLVLTKNGLCAEKCPDGTVRIDGKCADCTNPRCKTCTVDLDTCTSCPKKNYLYNKNCVSECPSKTTLIGERCEDCQIPCLECVNSIDNCSSCIDTYLIENGKCSSTCPDGKIKVDSKCEDCPIDCLVCSNTQNCDKCVKGKYLVDGKCVDNCPTGFYSNEDVCKPCSSNCNFCICSKNCNICNEGFSLFQKTCVPSCPDGYTSVISEIGSTCEKCSSDCLICNPNNTLNCVTCKDGAFLLDSKCVTVCPSGYYTNIDKKICEECKTPFCANCEDSETCKKCDDEKVLINNICVDECPLGYKLIGTTCEKCKVENCSICIDSTDICNQCSAGFFKLDDLTCVEICPIGTFADPITQSCAPCNSTCYKCQNSSTCEVCVNGTFLNKDLHCVVKCPSGTVEDSITGKCEPCSKNCKECESNNHDICDKCMNGYYLNGTECSDTCPIGTFKNFDTNTCDKCPYTCTECDSLDKCTNCKEGLLLVDDECVDTCPEFFVKIDGKCSKCQTSIDCLKCCSVDPTKCIDCGSKILFEGRCIDNCPEGFRKLSNNTCEKCPDNCKICSNEITCSECLSPFVLKKSGKCAEKCCVGFVAVSGICERCDDTNCEICTSDRECTKCQEGLLLKIENNSSSCVKVCGEGYYIDSGKCLPCGDLNCLECTNSKDCKKCNNDLNLLNNSQCVTVCPDGMTPKDGFCVVCEAGCLICSQTTNTECLKCDDSKVLYNGDCLERCPEKYVKVSDQCSQCPENCLICSSKNIDKCDICDKGFVVSNDGSCDTSCKDGYLAVDGKCEPCSIDDCSLCLGSVNSCKECKPPKILSLTADKCLPSCPPGQYQLDGQCSLCNNCPSCSDETGFCTACDKGFFLTSQGTCKNECLDGQVKVGDDCLDCRFENCKICPQDSLDICLECKDNQLIYNNKCVEICPDGSYNLDDIRCSACGDNCKTCEDNTECIECLSPFVNQNGVCKAECNNGFINIEGICVECGDSVRCNRCKANSLNECESCKAGFVLLNGKCVTNCECNQFIDHTIDGDVCTNCKDHCKLCIDSSSCQRCDSPFILQINDCVQECKDGYVRVGVECKKCSNSLCKLCTSDDQNVCDECKDGYVLKDNQCTDSCGLGYYAENKVCKPCNDQNCLSCTNQGITCIDCKDNFYLFNGICVSKCPLGYVSNSSDICEKCTDDKCKICQSNNLESCIECLNGFLLGELCVNICPQGFYGDNKICLPCLQDCIECTSSSDCKQCNSESKLINNTCVPQCPEKTVSDSNGKCVPCTDLNCLRCDVDQDTCKICATPFILKDGKCVDDCGDEYFYDGSTCQPCETRCAKCNSSTNCTKCDDNSFLFNQDCYENCPQFTYPDNGICKYCVDSEKCRECSFENPAECKDCKSGILFKGECINSCPDGTYYNSNDKECEDCEVNCLLCKSDKNCDKCKIGLVLFEDNCLETCPNGYVKVGESCKKCDDNCKTCCKSNQSKCKSCHDDLILYEDRCISNCPEGTFKTDEGIETICKPCGPNCIECNSFTECKVCSGNQVVFEGKCIDDCPSGFVKLDEQCVPCGDSNCVVCSSLNVNTCKECKDNLLLFNKKCVEECPEGYFINIETNSCDKCDDTCKTCKNLGECVECKFNLYFSEGTFHCEPCIEPHIIVDSECRICKAENCDKCIKNDTTCEICHGTFVLIDGLCIEKCQLRTFKVGQECKDCGSNCLECTNETRCDKCEEFKVVLDGQCVDVCHVGYGVNDNNECIECLVPDCEKCDGNKPEKCLHCLSNFSLHDNKCTEDCPPGHFHKDDDTCNDCSDHCLSCEDEKECEVCDEGFYLKDGSCTNNCGVGYFADKIAGTCVPCDVTFCEICTTDSCTKCNDGFYLHDDSCVFECPEGYYKNALTGECSQCSAGCKNCIDDKDCLICIEGLALYDERCVPVCPLGTTKINEVCLPCSDPACEVCSVNNPGTCEKCSSGFLIGTSCVAECPKGFYPDNENKICLPCNNRCSTCNGPDLCEECKPEFDNLDGKCINKCKEGEFRKNDTCESCGIDNCSACILLDGKTSCVDCKDKIPFNGDCVEGCPNGFFEQDRKCLPCSSGCVTCSSLEACIVCKDNLFLLDGKCLPGCVDGTYPVCGQPLTCKSCDSSCTTCFGEGSNKCKACANGFFLKGTSCLEELHCQNGYFPNAILNICEKCEISHCDKCADLNNCASCERFFDLKDGLCISNGSIELVYPGTSLQTPFAIHYNEVHQINIRDFQNISYPANTLSIVAWIRDLGTTFTLNQGAESIFYKYSLNGNLTISILATKPDDNCIIRISADSSNQNINTGLDCSSKFLFRWRLFILSVFRISKSEYRFELYVNGSELNNGSFQYSGDIINSDAKIILLSEESSSSLGSQIAKISVANYKINRDTVDKFALNSPNSSSWLCDNDNDTCTSGYITLDKQFASLNKEYKLLDLAILNIYDTAYKSFGVNFLFYASNINSDSFKLFDIVYPYASSEIKLTYALSLKVDATVSEAKALHNLIVIPTGIISENKWFVIYASIISNEDVVKYRVIIQDENLNQVFTLDTEVSSDVKSTVKLFVDSTVVFGCSDVIGQVYNPILFVGDYAIPPKSIEDISGILTCKSFGLDFKCKSCVDYHILDDTGICIDDAINLGKDLFKFENAYNYYERKIDIPEAFLNKDFTILITFRKLAHSVNSTLEKFAHSVLRLVTDSSDYPIVKEEISPKNSYATQFSIGDQNINLDFGDVDFQFINVAFSYSFKNNSIKVFTNISDSKFLIDIRGNPKQITLFDELGIEIHIEALNGVIYPKALKGDDMYTIVNRKLISADPVCQDADLTTGICKTCINKNISDVKCSTALYGLSSFQFFGADSVADVKSAFYINSQLKNSVNSSFYAITTKFRIYSVQDIEYKGSASYNIISLSNDVHLKYEAINPSLPILGLFLEVLHGKSNLSIRVNNSVNLTALNIDDFEVRYNKWISVNLFINTLDKKLEYFISSEDAKKHEIVDLEFFTERLQNAGKLVLLDDKIISSTGSIPCFIENIHSYVIPNPPTDTVKLVNLLETSDKYKPKPSLELPNCKYSTFDPIKNKSVCLICSGSYTYNNGECVKVPLKKNGYLILNELDNIRNGVSSYDLTYPFNKNELIFVAYFRISHYTANKIQIAKLGSLNVQYGYEDNQAFIYAEDDKIGPIDVSRFKSFNYIYVYLDGNNNLQRICIRQCGVPDYSNDNCITSSNKIDLPNSIEIDNSSFAIQIFGEQILQYDYEVPAVDMCNMHNCSADCDSCKDGLCTSSNADIFQDGTLAPRFIPIDNDEQDSFFSEHAKKSREPLRSDSYSFKFIHDLSKKEIGSIVKLGLGSIESSIEITKLGSKDYTLSFKSLLISNTDESALINFSLPDSPKNGQLAFIISIINNNKIAVIAYDHKDNYTYKLVIAQGQLNYLTNAASLELDQSVEDFELSFSNSLSVENFKDAAANMVKLDQQACLYNSDLTGHCTQCSSNYKVSAAAPKVCIFDAPITDSFSTDFINVQDSNEIVKFTYDLTLTIERISFVAELKVKLPLEVDDQTVELITLSGCSGALKVSTLNGDLIIDNFTSEKQIIISDFITKASRYNQFTIAVNISLITGTTDVFIQRADGSTLNAQSRGKSLLLKKLEKLQLVFGLDNGSTNSKASLLSYRGNAVYINSFIDQAALADIVITEKRQYIHGLSYSSVGSSRKDSDKLLDFTPNSIADILSQNTIEIEIPDTSLLKSNEVLYLVSNFYEASDRDLLQSDILPIFIIDNSFINIYTDNNTINVSFRKQGGRAIYNLLTNSVSLTQYNKINIQLQVDSNTKIIRCLVTADNVNFRFNFINNDIIFETFSYETAYYFNSKTNNNIGLYFEFLDSTPFAQVNPQKENLCNTSTENCLRCEVGPDSTYCTQCENGYSLFRKLECIESEVKIDKILLN